MLSVANMDFATTSAKTTMIFLLARHILRLACGDLNWALSGKTFGGEGLAALLTSLIIL